MVGAENVSVKIRLQSQPWHLFSGVIVRCILAASTLPHGREQAHKVMQAVADHREEFEFTDHCSGPNMDATPQQIIERIERYSGVLAGRRPLPEPELQNEIKWHSTIRPPERHSRLADLYGQRPGAAGSGQRRRRQRLGGADYGLRAAKLLLPQHIIKIRRASMSENTYQPPKVWEWKQNNGGAFANINRPDFRRHS